MEVIHNFDTDTSECAYVLMAGWLVVEVRIEMVIPSVQTSTGTIEERYVMCDDRRTERTGPYKISCTRRRI